MQKFIFLVFGIALTFGKSATCFSAQADWKTRPVVYGIAPYYLAQGYSVKGLESIRRRLPEIQKLGANIIWLQPITPPYEQGHGYDVMDFKKVWSELGDETDLKRLIDDAHKRGMGVLLDVVLNHSSRHHPFVVDIADKGKASPYYNFYQHAIDTEVPYGQFLNIQKLGKADFGFYFWEHLLNFNFESAELRSYLDDVLKYWVTEFDVDGFRFDASWAPSSRYPRFYAEIGGSLRALKSDIILMAEDKIGYPEAYRGTGHPHLKDSKFDWAYDWNNKDTDWISKWSFSVEPDTNETVFNLSDSVLATDYFIKALEFGKSEDGIKVLRYVENNDTPGLLKTHTLEQAKWSVAITMVLPGVPLVFYGQEVGNDHDLFNLPSFNPKKTIKSKNPSLWDFHQRLISIRKKSAALAEGQLLDLKRLTPSSLSFVRKHEGETRVIELRFDTRTVFLDGIKLN